MKCLFNLRLNGCNLLGLGLYPSGGTMGLHHFKINFYISPKITSNLFSPQISHFYLKCGWSCQVWMKKCMNMIEKVDFLFVFYFIFSKRWMNVEIQCFTKFEVFTSRHFLKKFQKRAGLRITLIWSLVLVLAALHPQAGRSIIFWQESVCLFCSVQYSKLSDETLFKSVCLPKQKVFASVDWMAFKELGETGWLTSLRWWGQVWPNWLRDSVRLILNPVFQYSTSLRKFS